MIEYWTTGLEGILATAYPLDFSWYIFFFLGDTFLQNANPLVGGKTWRDWTCLQPLNFSTSQPQPLSCIIVALCVFVAGISKCGEKSTTYLNQIPVEVLYCTVYIVPVQVTSKPMLVLFHPAWEKSVFAMLQIFLCKVLFVKRLTVLKIKIFTNYVITIFQKK